MGVGGKSLRFVDSDTDFKESVGERKLAQERTQHYHRIVSPVFPTTEWHREHRCVLLSYFIHHELHDWSLLQIVHEHKQNHKNGDKHSNIEEDHTNKGGKECAYCNANNPNRHHSIGNEQSQPVQQHPQEIIHSGHHLVVAMRANNRGRTIRHRTLRLLL